MAFSWSGNPSALWSPCATSIRIPSTPRSNQNCSTWSKYAATSGCRQLKSACSGAKLWRYHWPSVPSGSVTRCQADPPKMDRQLFGGRSPYSPVPSAKWNRSRSGLPGPAASAATNHWCSIEQWFGTMSMSTLRSSRCASHTSRSKDSSVPYSGCTPK